MLKALAVVLTLLIPSSHSSTRRDEGLPSEILKSTYKRFLRHPNCALVYRISCKNNHNCGRFVADKVRIRQTFIKGGGRRFLKRFFTSLFSSLRNIFTQKFIKNGNETVTGTVTP